MTYFSHHFDCVFCNFKEYNFVEETKPDKTVWAQPKSDFDFDTINNTPQDFNLYELYKPHDLDLKNFKTNAMQYQSQKRRFSLGVGCSTLWKPLARICVLHVYV